jgi:hypothetical protein
MSRRQASGLVALWAVALVTGGLAIATSDLPSEWRLLAWFAFALGATLLIGLSLAPSRDWFSDRWDWRGFGWRAGHLLLPVPGVETMIWLERRDGSTEAMQLRCTVQYPDEESYWAAQDRIHRTGDERAVFYSTSFPSSFANATGPAPMGALVRNGIYVVKWSKAGDVADTPLKRHVFRIRAGKLVGGEQPKAVRAIDAEQPPGGFRQDA